MQTQDSPRKVRLSPFTLLAVTALAVSNLMVGMLQGNTWLIAASSVISAAFAFVYAVRSGMLPAQGWQNLWPGLAAAPAAAPAVATARRFPLWMFLGLIFVLMPAVLLFLQSTAV